MADNNTRNDGSGDGRSAPTPSTPTPSTPTPSTPTPSTPTLASSSKTRGDWPWWGEFALALCAMVLAALFLIGLPYVVTIAVDGANDSTRPDAAKAWNAIVPSLLGLTTMTISGIFVFMTFRIDRGAKAEAREFAVKITKKTAEEVVRREVEKMVDLKIRKQLDNLLKKARGTNDVQTEEADQRMKARDDESKMRMDRRLADFDQRLEERFKVADERISERITDAQDRIMQKMSIAQEWMERAGRDPR